MNSYLLPGAGFWLKSELDYLQCHCDPAKREKQSPVFSTYLLLQT